MESIYNQMNKIDDKESLNEKYNVRTLKDVKELQENFHESKNTKIITGEDLRVAISEELPFAIEELGDNTNIDAVVELMTEWLDEASFEYNKQEVREVVAEFLDVDESVLHEDTRAQLIKKIKQDLNGANVAITTSDGNVHIHSNTTGADYDILFDKTAEVASTSSGYSKRRFTGNGTIVNGDVIDSSGTNLGPAFVGSPLTSNRYHYTIRSNDVKMPQTYDQMIAGLKADAL